MRRFLILFAGAAMAASVLVGLQVVHAPAVLADCPPKIPNCDDGPAEEPPPPSNFSDDTRVEQVTTPQRSCSVYANGAGFGSYCVSGGAGTAQTLRERFGSQKLQRCRYSDIPPGVQEPFNARPSEGRYMLMSCLGNVDFDTYSGGRDRTLDISIVFVPNGTDVGDRSNGITDFLWNQVENTTQLPVPFMRTRPNVTPLVGIPTYFTFRWLDPSDNSVVAQGPYSGRSQGGPFRQISENDFTMQARATSIRIDPNQEGIKAVTCDASTPYREGASPSQQPADACAITFPRSSASARRLATEPIPDNVQDAFYADVEVRWEVSYGEGDSPDQQLGDGFTMRIKQVVPVQEVQAPNQPPTVVY